MTNKLKPCPFCGNSEPRAAVTDIGPGYQTSLVRCRTCPAEICKTGIDAADYWNHRPSAWHNFHEQLPPIDRPVICRALGDGRVYTKRFRDDEPNVAFNDWQWMEVPE